MSGRGRNRALDESLTARTVGVRIIPNGCLADKDVEMIAIRDPKTELERPTGAPDDDPLAWRESDIAPVKLSGEGKSAAEAMIEDSGPEMPAERDSDAEPKRRAAVRPLLLQSA